MHNFRLEKNAGLEASLQEHADQLAKATRSSVNATTSAMQGVQFSKVKDLHGRHQAIRTRSAAHTGQVSLPDCKAKSMQYAGCFSAGSGMEVLTSFGQVCSLPMRFEGPACVCSGAGGQEEGGHQGCGRSGRSRRPAGRSSGLAGQVAALFVCVCVCVCVGWVRVIWCSTVQRIGLASVSGV